MVEAGEYVLANGSMLVANNLAGQSDQWQSHSLENALGPLSDPIVMANAVTANGTTSATTRVRGVNDSQFQVRLQEEQAGDGVVTVETVSFIAIEQSTSNVAGNIFQAFATARTVDDTNSTVVFDNGFASVPAFFANQQTFAGADPATVRYTSLDATSATFFAEEEQSADAEVTHAAEVVGGLVIETGTLFGQPIPQSARFIELTEHILGIDTMTVSQLQSWDNGFQGESGTLNDRLDDFVAAVQVVRLYENAVGPLFTSQGQASFASSWNGETNVGRALARTMLSVYQAVFDAIDNDLVSQQTAIVDGIMFRSTENFPGTVPNPSDPTAIYQVQIDGTLEDEYGSDGGYNTNAARRMTGAYLAPGTVAEVIVPNELVGAGFTVRVGGHSWDLSNKNNANRLYRVSNTFAIRDNVVQIANPMGGNIYIEVPVGAEAGIVDVQFRNTIRAPFFSNRSFDQTSQSDWENVERHHPGAFTDIESEHSMWTVPSKWVDDLGYANLMEIIQAHDANIQVASEYVGKNADRHKAILYMIVDTQIRGNAFSIGYPQSNYGSFTQNAIRDPLTLNNAFNKILWHEHGHAEFMTMFPGESESWIHMLAVSIGMENYGMTAQEAFAESLAYGSHNHTTSDTLSTWVVMDEFINGQNMAFQQGSYRPRGHADYVEYVEMFGLEAMQNFNRRINIEMDGLDWDDWNNGRTNHNHNDRILRLSREAGVNVAPLFHLWGHAPSNASALNTALQAEGLGASVQIYDRMIEARDSVPMSQAEWNAVDNVMRDFLNESRGPWAALRSNYDVSRGQDAIDRIQVLIDLYFPTGRPDEGPAVVPIAASVIAFSEPNFGGTPWVLDEGLYQVPQLNAGPIGNDNISSILIPEGYEVRLAQWQDNGGRRATYTDSIADLGLLEDDVSRVQVISMLDYQEAIGESDTISLTEVWETVTLRRTYDDPVVIAGVPSYNGTDPTTVRIRNVTSNSFEMQMDDWDYLGAAHSSELVSYMVVESGRYTLDDGTIIEARNQTGQTHVWQTYGLEPAFDGPDAPIVLANVITRNDAAAVTARVQVNSNSEFQVRLQEQESADGVHFAETLSYFAIQPGAGATGGLHYDAGTFSASHTGQSKSFDPAVRLSSISSFFAAMQTNNGPDTASLRKTILNAAGTRVFVDEEQSGDNEVSHGAETIGFFAIDPGLILGSLAEVDFGDAGAGYPTLRADDGARHIAVGPRLGAIRDTETDGVPSVDADGDGADEDGVMFGAITAGSSMAGVNVDLQNAANARVDAWIDFNGDGAWDVSEQILDSSPVIAGLQTLNFMIPVDAVARDTVARVRLSTAGGLEPTGAADDGEVEDYLVSIVTVNPPTVESVEINRGATQRSILTEIAVTFDTEVVAVETAFQLINRDSLAAVDSLVVNSSVVNGKTVSLITFAPGNSIVTRANGLHSLADGNYELTINGAQVSAVTGGAMMAGQHTYGDEATDLFFRFFGDSDGDRDVDGQDYGRFGLTFLKAAGDSNYNTALDVDGDDDIDGQDYGRFGLRFLQTLSF